MDNRAKLWRGHVGQDSSPREEVLASYRYLDSVLESMLDAVIVANPDGTIRTVNRAAMELLGYAEEEIVGRPVGTIFEEEEEFFRGTGLAKLVREGAVRDVELTLFSKSGERIPVVFNGSVIREADGRLTAVVGVARDMRETKRLIGELSALNRASQTITSSLDVQKVLDQIVHLAASVVNAAHAAVVLVEQDGSLGVSAETFHEGPTIEVRVRPQGITRQIIASSQPRVFDEVSDNGIHNPVLVARGIRSYAGLPLTAKGKVLGALLVYSHVPATFRGRLPLLTTFANQAAIAIENARLYEEVSRARKELEKQVEKLEKFFQITMGREKRIMELKREVRKLKKKLGTEEQGRSGDGEMGSEHTSRLTFHARR